MNKKTVVILLAIISLGAVLAYGALKTPEPPAEVIQEGALLSLAPDLPEDSIRGILSRKGITLERFDIVNQYPRKIGDEKVMIYEAKLVCPTCEGTPTTTYGVVKRGNSWYFVWNK